MTKGGKGWNESGEARKGKKDHKRQFPISHTVCDGLLAVL